MAGWLDAFQGGSVYKEMIFTGGKDGSSRTVYRRACVSGANVILLRCSSGLGIYCQSCVIVFAKHEGEIYARK